MAAYTFKEITLFDSSASQTHGAISWVQLPPSANNIRIVVDGSGTASIVNVFQAMDTSITTMAQARNVGQKIIGVATSATYHAMPTNSVPRYLGCTTSDTWDCHTIVKAYFVDRLS